MQEPRGSAEASAGIEPSVGSTGDSYDNALAETINGLFKAEIIHRRAVENARGGRAGDAGVGLVVLTCSRLLEPIGHIPPAEAEAHCWRRQAQANAPTKPAEPAALQEG